MNVSIANIPGFFPSDYSEEFYIDARSTFDGIEPFIVETEKKHRILNDATYENRKVQAVFYDKYILELITTESTNIGLLNIANEIIITTDSGEQHKAKFITPPQGEKLQNSDFKKYVLTYIDLNSKETVNYLDSATCTSSWYTKLEFNKSVFLSTFKLYVYSKIYPELDISEFELSENKDTGLTYSSSQFAAYQVRAYFFVNEEYKNYLKNEIVTSELSAIKITAGTNAYIARETPIITISESDLEGLYPVEVLLKYEKIENYPYE